jgi:hypothetical protein
MSTWQELIISSLVEINSYAAGEPPDNVHIVLGMDLLNDIVDQWAARRVYAYCDVFTAYTLTAAHQPHKLGPGLAAPDFAGARPARVKSAAIILTTSVPNIDIPINIRDADWWANKRIKALASNIPTDLYRSMQRPTQNFIYGPFPIQPMESDCKHGYRCNRLPLPIY